ncbi:MAG: 5-methyltetrahydrofolate--homocysteine methyltransferase, partial [Rhodothermaceae bacterium]|nr:5-methyltetrahydrofolate--homocysteine methyltransferase [Rhodothermaceae bacterium]
HVGKWAQDGIVNFLGGCCGTTPDHVREISNVVEGLPPRSPVPSKDTLRLAGLEPFELGS